MDGSQDARAVIDAKSAAQFMADKLRQLQRAAQTAAQTNAALINAKLVDPEVGPYTLIWIWIYSGRPRRE